MKNINLTNKTSTLNNDITISLIDTTLEQTFSIMYNRQATYFYLMKLNGWDKKELQKTIKARAKLCNVDLNRGVLSRESSVAEYAIDKMFLLFKDITINKDFNKCIHDIANIMISNDIKYNSLKDRLVNKKADNESGSMIPQESVKTADSQESEVNTITLKQVLKFIEKASDKDIKTILKVVNAKTQQKVVKIA